MNRTARGIVLVVAALAWPLAARAERIERTFPATPELVVELRNLNGQVDVRAWDQPQVQVVAVRRSQAVEIHFEQAGSRIHIHTHLLQASAPASDRVVDYEVWAPTYAALKLRLEAGTLRVEGFNEDVSVESVAADVVLRNLGGHTEVSTLNGSVRAERCRGRIEATSISGSLRFQDTESRYLVANTTAGDIYYEGDLQRGGSYEFINHDGDIDLLVPANSSFELNANSVQGEVLNEFPLKPRTDGRAPQRSGARSLLGTVHTGDAMVRATTFSGTIRVRRR